MKVLFDEMMEKIPLSSPILNGDIIDSYINSESSPSSLDNLIQFLSVCFLLYDCRFLYFISFRSIFTYV